MFRSAHDQFVKKSRSFDALAQSRGFTLVELLVVIAIITVLSVVGVAVYRGVTGGARDAKRKSDIEGIAKAYEVKYTSSGSYQAVINNDFSNGVIPQDPAGGNYYSNLNGSSAFRVCAALESNPARTCSSPSVNCYCLSSAQGSYSSGGSGGSLDHPSTCDPNGTLGLGLVGYWKLNEGSGTTTADFSGNSNNGTISGGSVWQTGSSCATGSCLLFPYTNSSYSRIPIISSSSLNLGNSDFTVSGWVTAAQPVSQNGTGLFGKYPHTTSYNGNFLVGFGDLGSNNRIFFGHRNASGVFYTYYVNDYSAYWGQKTLITWTKTNSTLTLYLNNQQKQSWNISAAAFNVNFYGNGSDYYISYTGWTPGVWPNVVIDDHRVYNRALLESEVSVLYNSGNGCAP